MVWVIISREGGGKTHTVTPFKLSIQQQFLTWFPTGLTKIDPKTYGQGLTPPPLLRTMSVESALFLKESSLNMGPELNIIQCIR